MARAASHFSRRGAIYVYRRRVPENARGSAFFGDKPYYQVTLRTSDLNEAKAKALAVGLRFDAEVRMLLEGSAQAKPLRAGIDRVLSDEALEAIQAKWFDAGVKRDREKRAMAEVDLDGDWAHQLDAEDEDLHYLVSQLNDPERGRAALVSLKHRLKTEWAGFIKVEARRWNVSPASPDYIRIEKALVDAQVEVLRAAHLGWIGQEQEPTSAAVKRGLARQLKPQSSWTLTQLANHVLEVGPKRASWHHKVKDQVVPLFVSHLGKPTPISAIKSDDVRSFIEALRQCPTNASQRFPGLSLQQAIHANRERPQSFPVISPNTIRDTHYAVLRSLFRYAVSQDWLPVSPVDRVKVTGTSKKGGSRPSFKVDELNLLFRLPVFAGCESDQRYGTPGNFKLDDHRYWTPLLMLFSGARPSELGQLAVSDIKLDASVPYISILTEFDPNDPEDRAFYMTQKTVNARREIPLHPTLLKLGFDKYVERMRLEGHARLFPHWPQPSDPRKLYSSARWIRKFNEDFIPRVTKRKPKPTFYSFRHTFKVAMATQGIYAAIQNQILGHANVGMDAYYFDAVTMDELLTQISKVQVRHLDISHLMSVSGAQPQRS